MEPSCIMEPIFFNVDMIATAILVASTTAWLPFFKSFILP
jgi:hypothetical protein